MVPCLHGSNRTKSRQVWRMRMKNTQVLSSRASRPTRRELLAGATFAVASFGLASGEAFAQTAPEVSHAEDAIHQEPVFKASRKLVYETLTDAKQFQKVILLSAAIQSGMAK